MSHVKLVRKRKKKKKKKKRKKKKKMNRGYAEYIDTVLY